MVYKRLSSLSLCFIPLLLGAQTAEDYFHGGAQSYVWEKDREAEAQISTGLRRYPNDPLLNGLAGLLKKQEEKKQQQQSQQQQQDEQKNQDQQKQQQQKQQDQQKQAEQNQQQKSSEQQKAEQQKKEEEQKQAANQSKEDKQAQQSAEQSKDKGDAKEQEAAAAQAAGQMTPQQAQQLLDAQKGDEQMLPVQPTGKPVDRNRFIKDW
jgi:septal ring factor EnvC (AmiA/AmiB activator)